MYRIPFNRPHFVGPEFDYMAAALAGGHISGDGGYTRQCSQLLEEALCVPRALITTSCTHALEMAALLLDIAPGDEVILPSFTFVSTANAFVLRGARPVFADVAPDTLNIDPAEIRARRTERTRAVVVVHYGGVACDMDGVLDAARGLPVVEDNAHGLFGAYRGKWLGTFGALATLSFHETKSFTCGEGGALLVNDPALVERAEILREKGTDRARFKKGLVDKYRWVDLGSSYLPSDLLAAVLLAQLRAREAIMSARQRIWERYAAELADWARRHDVRLPFAPAECAPAYHLFHLVMPSERARDALIAHLAAAGILAVFHYVPLHAAPFARRFAPSPLPVTEAVSARLVRLPFFTSMSAAEQEEVIACVRRFTP